MLLAAALAVPLVAQPQPRPSLVLSTGFAHAVLEPGQTVHFDVMVRNHSETPATNVELTVTVPDGGTIVGAEPVGEVRCSFGGASLVCTAASLTAAQPFNVRVFFVAPTRTDGPDIFIESKVTSAEEDLDPADNRESRQVAMVRHIFVTNVEDQGSGSLRQAIHDVNGCEHFRPCSIVFRIPGPVPEQGWFTIQPRTPLPEITGGTLTIDGRTQTLFTGDTNLFGPEIEIDGVHVREQSGLRVQPNCHTIIRNLAVNHFPGYGIALRGPGIHDHCIDFTGYALITENHLGIDPPRRTIKPNQRGLGVFSREALVYDNLIIGNRRSGIYIQDGRYHDIRRNRITDNSCGIFVDMGSVEWDVFGADIVDNTISHNDGMAIARSRRGEIFVSRNRIFDNLQQGIDVDVDGPTPQRSNDVDVPNAPVLFDATYDPSRNVTIVRGRIDSETLAHSRFIEVYASLRNSVWSTPQAEESVATMVDLLTGHENFEIEVEGDLRGKWITATYNVARLVGFIRRGIATETHRESHPADTSELSNSVFAR